MANLTLFRIIVHFKVVCLVTWPMNQSEAGVDLVLIETLIAELRARRRRARAEHHG